MKLESGKCTSNHPSKTTFHLIRVTLSGQWSYLGRGGRRGREKCYEVSATKYLETVIRCNLDSLLGMCNEMCAYFKGNVLAV